MVHPRTNGDASPDNRAPGALPVAFRFHARALAALGRDLVTNDIVAVMELVKNSYDALARSVEVRIQNPFENGRPSSIESER